MLKCVTQIIGYVACQQAFFRLCLQPDRLTNHANIHPAQHYRSMNNPVQADLQWSRWVHIAHSTRCHSGISGGIEIQLSVGSCNQCISTFEHNNKAIFLRLFRSFIYTFRWICGRTEQTFKFPGWGVRMLFSGINSRKFLWLEMILSASASSTQGFRSVFSSSKSISAVCSSVPSPVTKS